MHELGSPFSTLPRWARVKLVGFYIASGYVKIAIEHGPVEIVRYSEFSHWKWWIYDLSIVIVFVFPLNMKKWWIFPWFFVNVCQAGSPFFGWDSSTRLVAIKVCSAENQQEPTCVLQSGRHDGRFFGGKLECLMIEHDQNIWAGNVVKITFHGMTTDLKLWLLNVVDERQRVELVDIY